MVLSCHLPLRLCKRDLVAVSMRLDVIEIARSKLVSALVSVKNFRNRFGDDGGPTLTGCYFSRSWIPLRGGILGSGKSNRRIQSSIVVRRTSMRPQFSLRDLHGARVFINNVGINVALHEFSNRRSRLLHRNIASLRRATMDLFPSSMSSDLSSASVTQRISWNALLTGVPSNRDTKK
jgi:hypothetical protein